MSFGGGVGLGGGGLNLGPTRIRLGRGEDLPWGPRQGFGLDLLQSRPFSGSVGLRSFGSRSTFGPQRLPTSTLGPRRLRQLGIPRSSLGRQPTILGRRTSLSGSQPVRTIRVPLSRGGPVRLSQSSRGLRPISRTPPRDLLQLLSRSYGPGTGATIRRTRNGIPVIRVPARRNVVASPVRGQRITQSRDTSRSVSTATRESGSQLQDQIIALFAMDHPEQGRQLSHTGETGSPVDELKMSETIAHATKVEKITKDVKQIESAKSTVDGIIKDTLQQTHGTDAVISQEPSATIVADATITDADQVNINLNQTAEVAAIAKTEASATHIEPNTSVTIQESQAASEVVVQETVPVISDAHPVVVAEPVSPLEGSPVITEAVVAKDVAPVELLPVEAVPTPINDVIIVEHVNEVIPPETTTATVH